MDLNENLSNSANTLLSQSVDKNESLSPVEENVKYTDENINKSFNVLSDNLPSMPDNFAAISSNNVENLTQNTYAYDSNINSGFSDIFSQDFKSVDFTCADMNFSDGFGVMHSDFSTEENCSDAKDEIFHDAVQFFKDPSTFTFLENAGSSNVPSDPLITRSSLYVNFDPLHAKFYSQPTKDNDLKGIVECEVKPKVPSTTADSKISYEKVEFKIPENKPRTLAHNVLPEIGAQNMASSIVPEILPDNEVPKESPERVPEVQAENVLQEMKAENIELNELPESVMSEGLTENENPKIAHEIEGQFDPENEVKIENMWSEVQVENRIPELLHEAEVPIILPEDKVPIALPDAELHKILPEAEVPMVLPEDEVPIVLPEDEVPTVLPEDEVPIVLPEAGVSIVLPEAGVPIILPEADVPKVLPGNEVPKVVTENEVPKVLPENEVPNVLPENEVPNVLPENEVPKVVTENEVPKVVTENEVLIVVTENEVPKVLPKAEVPMVLPEPEVPLILSKAEVPMVLPEAKVPKILPEAEVPKVLPEAKVPVVLLEAKVPMVLPEAEVPKVVPNNVMPEVLSESNVSEEPDIFGIECKIVNKNFPVASPSPRVSIGNLLSFDSPVVDKNTDFKIKQDNEPPKLYTEEEFQQILKIQELSMQDAFLKKEHDIELERTKKQKEMEAKFKEQSAMCSTLQSILIELYDIVIVQSNKELALQEKLEEAEKENTKLKQDLKTSVDDLQGLENTFSDFHKRYEHCKSMLKDFTQNEANLKIQMEDLKVQLAEKAEMYKALQSRTQEMLDKANVEVSNAEKAADAQIAVLKAQLKKSELKISSLESDVKHVKVENEKLGSICDELMAKVSER